MGNKYKYREIKMKLLNIAAACAIFTSSCTNASSLPTAEEPTIADLL